MSTQVQYRRGSNVQVAAFTGALGELVIDTTNKVVVVNDGATAGGFPQVGLTATQTLTNKTLTSPILTTPNIGVATGTSVSTTGNIAGGNITTAGQVTATANITGGNILTSGIVSSGGNVIGGNITTVGSISSTGTITGGNLNTGGNITATGYISVTGNLYVSNVISQGNLTVTDPLVYFINTSSYPYNYDIGFYSNFNGGAGNTYQHSGLIRDYTDNTWKFFSNVPEPSGSTLDLTNAIYDPLKMGVLTVNVSSNAAAIVNGGSNGVGNIGSSTGTFNTVFAKATTAQYADLAEMYVADQSYQPGTLVVFGGANEITVSTESHDPSVAGIISTDPAYLMNSAQLGNNVLAVALTGRVPCRVVGSIRKGDRLVASGLHAGVASALDMSQYQPGCIVGKALEDYQSTEVGTIEVAVGRT